MKAAYQLEVELKSFEFIHQRLKGGMPGLSEYGLGYMFGLARAVEVLKGNDCGVVQQVERGTVNADVGGSSPSAAAIPPAAKAMILSCIDRIRQARTTATVITGLDWRSLAESIERDLRIVVSER